jgi:hypothetical protein
VSTNLRQRVARLAKARGTYDSVPADVLARRQAYLREILRWYSTPEDKRPPKPAPPDPDNAEALRLRERFRAAMRARGISLEEGT